MSLGAEHQSTAINCRATLRLSYIIWASGILWKERIACGPLSMMVTQRTTCLPIVLEIAVTESGGGFCLRSDLVVLCRGESRGGTAMKIALFDDWRVGVVEENRIADVTGMISGWTPAWPFAWMLQFIDQFDQERPRLEQFLTRARRLSLNAVKLKAPVPMPSKVIAAPVNYVLHQQEMGGGKGVYANANIKTIEHYGLFLKPSSSVVGPEAAITLPFSGRRTDHEAEVGVIIGKTVKNIVESEADRAIFGITGLLDLSVRGQEDRPFRKGFDGFCPIGPWMVTHDEIPHFEDIDFELRVNGVVRQIGNTRNMIYSIRRLVSLASYQTTLYPGDIIATGTPEGVGEVKPGDRLHLTVNGVGTLAVAVADAYAGPPPRMGEWFDKFQVARGSPA